MLNVNTCTSIDFSDVIIDLFIHLFKLPLLNNNFVTRVKTGLYRHIELISFRFNTLKVKGLFSVNCDLLVFDRGQTSLLKEIRYIYI